MALRIPGIIVRVVNDTGIVAPPAYQRYPVIIGEGDPYRLQTNVRLRRGAGNTDALPTVTTVNEIVSVGDLPGIVNYTSGTDYSLNGNSVDWNHGGDTPIVGDYYYVTFTETRPTSAYIPTLYFDESLIYTDHGGKIRTNGAINDVSVGGYLALNAGAKGVIIAQLDLSAARNPDSPTDTELENAFIAMRDELEKITDYKLFLVPMSSGIIRTTSAANIFFNHAVICSEPENKQERTVISALEKGTNVLSAAAYAAAYHHERMVVPLCYNGISRVVGDSTEYDTRFYCASIAGKICSVPIGRNISDEIIPNVLVTDNFTPSELEYLVQNGVGPAKLRGEVVRNVFIGTTDTTSALTEDLGVQDVKDYVKKYWREGLWNLYKNAPINPALVVSIESSSRSILTYLIAQNIISQYKDILVTQDTVEPRKVLITGKIKPAYGLQWMDVTFTFVLSF